MSSLMRCKAATPGDASESKPRNAKGANFTPEQYAEIARLLREGKRNGEILMALEVKYRTFYDRMDRAGVEIGERTERFLRDKRTGEELTPERFLEIAEIANKEAGTEINNDLPPSS